MIRHFMILSQEANNSIMDQVEKSTGECIGYLQHFHNFSNLVATQLLVK
jgi:hypothetical protein